MLCKDTKKGETIKNQPKFDVGTDETLVLLNELTRLLGIAHRLVHFTSHF